MGLALLEIIALLQDELKPLGFNKIAKRIWRRETGAFAQLFWLDKSSYTDENRLTLFVDLPDEDGKKRPLISFRARFFLEAFVPQGTEVKLALTPSSPGDLVRHAELLRACALPVVREFVHSTATPIGLGDLVQARWRQGGMITMPDLHAELGLPHPYTSGGAVM